MRQPVFLRLRDDLDPAAIVRETAAPPPPPAPRPRSRSTAPKAENLEIGGRPVAISHADKLYWPDDGLTKGDAVEYYRKLAPVLLPYLRDRPLSLLRFPDGINGDRFYHKDFGSHAPDWVTTVTRDDDRALVCQDEATLAYVANLAGIELHPWHSRRQELERPDYCVIDLDPLEIDLDSVVRVAQEVRAVLAAAGVTGHPKTSGGDGLHVYLPLGALYDYAQSLQFATLVGHLVHARLPELTSLERNPDKRRGRVYLDCLQNRRGQTVIAPYSLRARRGAPVSTPLRWEEVAPELDPLAYNLRTFSERLLQVGDLWAPVLGPGIDMLDALRRLEELAKTPSTSASARRG
jgi:bifunctional non-homologous end joining protein LigD